MFPTRITPGINMKLYKNLIFVVKYHFIRNFVLPMLRCVT